MYQIYCFCSTQALERQLTQRDSVISRTTLALQSLDQKNMAGIGDLRGRVARYAHKPTVCTETPPHSGYEIQQCNNCWVIKKIAQSITQCNFTVI